jgi:hypothetical protein
MKADMPLRERQGLEAEDQRAIRAALVRRHANVLDEQHAIEGAQIAIDIRGSAFRELAGRMRG